MDVDALNIEKESSDKKFLGQGDADCERKL